MAVAQKSKIEWPDRTWNPVTGCTEVSPGCDNCYARAMAERFRGNGFPNGFDVTLKPHKLRTPESWREPSRIFVHSMSDLFHRDIPDSFLVRIWDTMMRADHHIYQILTKRAHRMAYLVDKLKLPMPEHIWLGVSAASGDGLASLAGMWPTPTASDIDKQRYRSSLRLSGTVMNLWQTPTAHETEDGAKSRQGEFKLAGQSRRFPLSRTASTPGHECSTRCRRLNPLFVEMLMGWPIGWTLLPSGLRDYESSATEWSRWWRLMRSELSRLERDCG